MGRPPAPPDKKFSRRVTVWMTEAERERIGRKAEKLGVSLSECLMKPWRE